MTTTYQASSGIYPIIVILISLLWYREKRNIKEIGKFILLSILAFGIGIAIFKFLIMQPANSYVGNEMWELDKLINGCIINLKRYYTIFLQSFRKVWLIAIGIIYTGFILLTTIKSKNNKVVTFLLSIIAIIFISILTFGLYITLKKPSFSPRAMYGIGVVIALLGVQCCNMIDKGILIKGICIFLSYSFIAFSFTYGNALSEQKRYTDYRIELVLADLNDLNIMTNNKMKVLQISGNIGRSPIVMHMAKEYYKMLDKLVPNTFGGDNQVWAEYYFRNYFSLNHVKNDTTIDLRKKDLPILKDTIYHTIKGDEKNILIILK